MSAEAMNTYEGMFIVESVAGSTQWESVRGELERIMKKAGATPVALDKWAERKLAYRIRRNDRGVYVLAYFTGPAAAVTGIKQECGLSETILRTLILRHEGEIKKIEAPREYERREEKSDMPGGGHRPRY